MIEFGGRPAVDSSAAGAQHLPAIRAVQLEIRTRWQRPNMIPGPVLGNLLRGAVGLTLRHLVCPEGWHDNSCHPCPLYSECAYGHIFMPTPGEGAAQLRLQSDLPRPFVIEPPGLHPDDRVTSEGLTFRLMLFGTAIERLAYFISTLERLGSDGLGRDRVSFRIERITACHPAGNEVIYHEGSNAVSLPKQVINTQDLISTPWPAEAALAPNQREVRQRVLARMGRATSEPVAPDLDPARPRLKLRFITPLLLKSGSGVTATGERKAAQEIRERPPMGVIIRRLRDRVSSLSAFFGERWDCPDFSHWGTLADEVPIVESRTTWLTRNRHSSRTGHKHEISGLVGFTTYEFPDQTTFDTLSPLLRIGELIHVGKNAPWGNGAVRGIAVGKV